MTNGGGNGGTEVTVLSHSFRVGKKHRGLYLQMVVGMGRGRLTAHLNGRILKRWPPQAAEQPTDT